MILAIVRLVSPGEASGGNTSGTHQDPLIAIGPSLGDGQPWREVSSAFTRKVNGINEAHILARHRQEHLRPKAEDAPTVISLFAGCGGSSLGYSMAGFRELPAVEWDGNAVETLKPNFPGVPVWQGDIAELSVEECLRITGLKPGDLDVLDGSPPCQGFSTAGKRKMADCPRAHSALGWRSATRSAPCDTAEDSEQDGDSEERGVEGLSAREREECRNDEAVTAPPRHRPAPAWPETLRRTSRPGPSVPDHRKGRLS